MVHRRWRAVGGTDGDEGHSYDSGTGDRNDRKVIILIPIFRNPISISDCVGTVEIYFRLNTLIQILTSPNICPPPPRVQVYFSWNATPLCNFEVCLNGRPEGTDLATNPLLTLSPSSPEAWGFIQSTLTRTLGYLQRGQMQTSTDISTAVHPLRTHLSHKFWKIGLSTHLYEICALLGYYAASCGICLPTFRDNVQVPSSRVDFLTLEDGTYTLSRNVGKQLPHDAA
jgi:hypothetical protein